MTIQRIKLGKFAQDSSGAIYGRVSGLGIGSTVVVSYDAKSADGKPYLKLVAESGSAAYEVGVAFAREKDGLKYFSVILDSPLLPTSINAALFPDAGNTGMMDLVWNRSGGFDPAPEADRQVSQSYGRRYNGANATP